MSQLDMAIAWYHFVGIGLCFVFVFVCFGVYSRRSYKKNRTHAYSGIITVKGVTGTIDLEKILRDHFTL